MEALLFLCFHLSSRFKKIQLDFSKVTSIIHKSSRIASIPLDLCIIDVILEKSNRVENRLESRIADQEDSIGKGTNVQKFWILESISIQLKPHQASRINFVNIVTLHEPIKFEQKRTARSREQARRTLSEHIC